MKNIVLLFMFIAYTNTIGTNTIGAQTQCEPDMYKVVTKGAKGDNIPLPTLEEPWEEAARSGDDKRMLHWIHGINGDSDSWSRANDATENDVVTGFPARKVIATQIDYNQNQLFLAGAANIVRQNITTLTEFDNLPQGYDKRDGMIIAHSQGGLVAREIDRYYSLTVNQADRDIGGIATFGTSHQGAPIVNNKFKLLGLGQSLAIDLLEGPLVAEINGNIFLSLLDAFFDLAEAKDSLIVSIIRASGLSLLTLEMPAISEDYKVGAAALDTLNAYEPDGTSLVAFYGVRDTLIILDTVVFQKFEGLDGHNNPIFVNHTFVNMPSPISWATVNYFQNPVNIPAHFTAMDSEHIMAARAHLMRLEYQAEADDLSRIINNYQTGKWVNLFYNPIGFAYLIIEQGQLVKERNAWMQGVTALDKFDRRYREAIGLMVIDSVQTSSYACVCTRTFGTAVEKIIPLYEGMTCEDIFKYNNDPAWDCEEELVDGPFNFEWRHKDSDGVVPAESAMNIPQHTWPPQPMLGSSHMSMRNDANTKIELKKIFDGDVGEFFETPEKN